MSVASTAASVAQSVRNSFNFTVDKFPLTGPERMQTPFYGLFRSDTGKSVGPAVYSGYEPHTVEDVAALAEAAVLALDSFGLDAKVTCQFTGHSHNVIVRPSDEYRRSIFGTQDNIFPRFIIDAGYGTCFRATLGMYRDVCRNLAIARSVKETNVAIRHTNGLRDRIDDLVTTFRGLDGKFDSVFTVAAKLEQKETDLASFIASVYPMPENASDRTRGIVERRAEAIVRRIMREREATGRSGRSLESGTLWEAVNAITGYVQHDKKRHGSPTIHQRALMGIEDADTNRAWDLALELAV
jgi:hypothetical protein